MLLVSTKAFRPNTKFGRSLLLWCIESVHNGTTGIGARYIPGEPRRHRKCVVSLEEKQFAVSLHPRRPPSTELGKVRIRLDWMSADYTSCN